MTTEKDRAFSVAEFRARLEKVREGVRARRMSGFLITTPENIFYLSGYQTPGYYAYQALLVPASDAEPVLILRRLEESNFRALSWFDGMRAYDDTQDPFEMTTTTCTEAGIATGTLGIEKSSWFLTVEQFERLQRLLPHATFVDGSGLVEEGRLVKSAAEIEYIRRGARAAEAAMRAGLEATAAGKTENDVAAEIHRAAILAGSEYTSLPQFIASGYRSSLTHATWAGRKIEPGDVVYYELCGTVLRYTAALYRGATIGPPSDKIKRMSEATIAGLNKVLEVMKPGVSCGEVAEAWAEEIVKGGFPKPYKRAGYSIGVSFPPDWGEGHILSLRYGERRVLEPGMVFHVPSSVREYGLGVVGNSETILVTREGCEALTRYPREHFVR